MSEVITFYSYKGGVGRTMALANASVVLSKWGHRVLVVDWDLEAPGLEHFYKDYIDIKLVEKTNGVIDFLQSDSSNNWKDDIIEINIPESNVPIHFISSGRRDEDYFKKVRTFDVDDFYEKDGGDIIERLRNEWLANYDYVLIDSRTGITEIGGICTIQLPDIVVMLFTATNQGFEGVLDIISRAGAAQQKLPYDRQKLIFLPIPSKFETNTEFKLSQDWLDKFAERLEPTYNDWLPASVNKKEFLELTKIPYLAYFSFGEKLPVIEQGLKDPSGLGYAYETLAAIIANRLQNVDILFNNRDEYIAWVNKFPSLEPENKKNGNGYILERRLKQLKQSLDIGEEVVNYKKDKEVVIKCVQNNIFPLLELVSMQIKNIGSIFKNINEKIEIKGIFTDYSNFEEGETAGFRIGASLVNLKDIRYVYSTYTAAGINSLNYSCFFENFRKSYGKDIQLPFDLTIEFHETVFEIKSDDGLIYIDKLYHETVSLEECEYIAQTIGISLLEKIDILKR